MLIDVDNLIKDIQTEIAKSKHRYEDIGCRCFRRGMDHAIRIARQLPTIEPVKHGHWIHVDELPSGDYFKCSECNNHIFLKFGWKVSFESPADEYHYCSLCGAKMDGKEE